MGQPLRWGILGTASIARQVIRGIGQSRVCVAEAVASRDLTRARAFAEEHGIPRAFGSYGELIESAEVDAVYIPLPNSLHAEWTLRAIDAGKPVLCEKPFTVSAAEARQVAAVSRRTGVPVAEAFMYRFHPMYARVFGLIETGAIGEVKAVRSAFGFFLSDRSQIPASQELAGGSLMDVGCYCVNLSRWVAGCEPLRAMAFERRTTVDDTLAGVLEFPNGVLAHFDCSIESNDGRGAEIVGTAGTIVLEDAWLPGETGARVLVRRGESEEWLTTGGGNTYQLEVEDFSRAVCTGGAPRWSLEDAVGNMAAIDALYESARTGQAARVAGIEE